MPTRTIQRKQPLAEAPTVLMFTGLVAAKMGDKFFCQGLTGSNLGQVCLKLYQNDYDLTTKVKAYGATGALIGCRTIKEWMEQQLELDSKTAEREGSKE